VRHLGRIWRECAAAEVARPELDNTDVCFEAKMVEIQKNRIVVDVKNCIIVCGEATANQARRRLKKFDNVWFVGTVKRTGPDGTAEVHLADFVRLPSDGIRFENRLQALGKARDDAGLLELGHRIARHQQEIGDFGEFSKLADLRNQCWSQGLELREAKLAADDAEGRFALAQQWLSLLNRRAKHRALIMQTLVADPNHQGAARIAGEDFGCVKFEGRWLEKIERDHLLTERKVAEARLSAVEKTAREERDRKLREAVKEREKRFWTALASTRVADAGSRAAAFRSMGESARDSADPIFARWVIRSLAETGEGEAVRSGLSVVVQSAAPEIRRDAYEALAWRKDDNALDLLSAALRSETHAQNVQSGVEAVADLRTSAAAKIIFRLLETADKEAEPFVLAGLKRMLDAPCVAKNDWLQWWTIHQKNAGLPFRALQ
jgi:hypothetical protein